MPRSMAAAVNYLYAETYSIPYKNKQILEK